MKVAIVGASANRSKYGNKAVRAYAQAGHTVFPIHPKEETIEGFRCYASLSDIQDTIDEVLMYVPPEIGITLVKDILVVHPKRLFLNPGSESDELIAALTQGGIVPIQACSIIAAGYHPQDFN